MEENTNDVATPQSSNKNMMYIGGAIAAVVILGGAFLLLNSNNSTNTATTNMSTPQASSVNNTNTASATPSAVSSPNAANAQVFNLEAGSFYYKPSEIKVKEGDTVKIVLSAKDMMHDFNIDELGVKIPVTRSGSTAEVTFVAPKAGKYEFYCSVGSHRQQGQVGTLIVE